MIKKDGSYESYFKIRLVPVSEYLPSFLSFLKRYYPIEYSLDFGNLYKVFELNNVKFSGVICFESIFPNFFWKFINKGAEFFTVSTNDGWFENTLAPYQHLERTRMRAIEENRYFVQAANSGISAVIDNRGNILEKMGDKKRGVLTSFIEPITDKSVYYYIKDYYIYFFIFILFVLFFYENREAK